MVHPDTYAAMLRQAFLPGPSLAAAAVP